MGVCMPVSPFGELLAVDERRTLEFFFTGLSDVCEPDVDRKEILYNASVLAHYSQVSCAHEGDDVPCPKTLMCVFDNHYNADREGDANQFEVAACQTLLLTGFFGAQMSRRHNVRWYKEICASFFKAASRKSILQERKEFFARMSFKTGFWAERQSRLQRDLRDTPYLLRLDTGRVQ